MISKDEITLYIKQLCKAVFSFFTFQNYSRYPKTFYTKFHNKFIYLLRH